MFLDQRGDAFEPHGTGCLDEDRVAGPQEAGDVGERRGVGDEELLLGAVEVDAGALADADDDLDPELTEQRSHLVVVARARVPELGHLAEDRHATPVACPLREVEERRAHRGGIRVVRVVDDEAAAGQLAHLPAPAAELDRGRPLVRPLERQAERVVHRERGEDVLGEVALVERQRELERVTGHGEAPSGAGAR